MYFNEGYVMVRYFYKVYFDLNVKVQVEELVYFFSSLEEKFRLKQLQQDGKNKWV